VTGFVERANGIPITRQAPIMSRERSFSFKEHRTGRAAVFGLKDKAIIVAANTPIGKLILGDVRQ
jgi:hypothetical protein